MDKNKLRKIIKEKRKQLQYKGFIKTASDKIVQKIVKSDIFALSKNIALYYPLKGEVDLLKLLEYKDKNFYFPKCINNDLCFAKYENDFIEGCFSIPEPNGKIINPNIFDVIYIPALCANDKCYRLGYGKGFYDRFFKNNLIPAKKIIVCPSCFILSDFKEDENDFKCDLILSDF